MAQEQHAPRSRSSSLHRTPLSPNPDHFQSPLDNEDRSVTRAMFAPPEHDSPNHKRHDLDTDHLDRSSNRLTTDQKQLISSENNSFIQNHPITKASTILSSSSSDELLDKNHTRKFPSDTSPLIQPMETNVEGNIHKLRLRLIDSDFKQQHHHHQNESSQRSHKQPPPSSPPSRKYIEHNVRSPSELVHQQYPPKILSRQTTLSIWTTTMPPAWSDLSRARKGTENHPRTHSKIDREADTQRIPKESTNRHHRSGERVLISNHSYDSRLYLEPLTEDQSYSTSNMDDLIDSMARRHLAYRHFNSSFDQQSRNSGYHSPYFDSLNNGQTSFRYQPRTDDIIYTNRSPRNQTERDLIRNNSNGHDPKHRSRLDHHNHMQSDSNDKGVDNSTSSHSYTKLPPIVSDSNSNRRHHHPQTPPAKHDSATHQQTLPSISTEHSIKLPSDIYITPKTHRSKSPKSTRKNRRRSISKDTRSETDHSDDETDLSTDKHRKKNSQKDDKHGRPPGRHVQQKKKTKVHRNLFKKSSIGILFIISLQHRAVQNRSHRRIQSPSTAIHKIRLQELLVALHRVYLEPDGPMFNALIEAVTHPISLEHALNRSSRDYSEALSTIGNALKNIISKIIQFMPKDGVLGTTKSSAISIFLQDGNPFPEKYFWQCEREHLEFDHLKLINITKQRAILLLIGLFIFRALVTTLLIKPVKYRLILGQLTASQSASLKVLSSVILYLGRRTVGSKSQILTLPHEWKLSLYTDAELEPIIQDSEIKSMIGTCQQSLRMWSEEYIRRIDESCGNELRK